MDYWASFLYLVRFPLSFLWVIDMILIMIDEPYILKNDFRGFMLFRKLVCEITSYVCSNKLSHDLKDMF